MKALSKLWALNAYQTCLDHCLIRSPAPTNDLERLHRHSGLLPWNKGVRGVKWRDLDEATFTQGFSSWVLRSYSIRVGHRFTKDSEISLSSMYNGKEAVRIINQVHQKLVAEDKLH